MKTHGEKDWLASLATTATPSIDECVDALGHRFEWLYEFKRTPQDPEWHGEGDVHIHTGMVLHELYKLLEDKASYLQSWQRQALVLGALFHDIGKPRRTKAMEIKGVERIASPQHEAVGRSYLAFKLMALDLPFKVIWTVLGLVGEHHMPKRLVVKNETKGQYIALSRRANLELLYWLEVADMKGRICPDVSQQLTILDEFKMFAEEYGLWNNAYQLNDKLAPILKSETPSAQDYIYSYALRGLEQGKITTPEEALAIAYEHKNFHSRLIAVCGPSGIGKSSWISKNCKGFEIISLDGIRAEINGYRSNQKNKGQVIHLAKNRLKACLRAKKNVVWDATNLRSDFRKIIFDFGRDYHALVSLVVFLSPEQDITHGNKNREFAVPDNILRKQLDDFQFPLVNDAHQFCVIDSKAEILFQSGYFLQNKEIHYER